MYLSDYLFFLIVLAVLSVALIIVNINVNKTFSKYNNVANVLGVTGSETATRLLNANGVQDVSVGQVAGNLTDHYDPRRKVLNLSQATYSSPSVGAVAVAAHEVGHAVQKHEGYFLFKLRNFLVPVVNIGSRLSMPLVFVGLLLDLFVVPAGEPTGFYIAMVGVALYGSALLFAFVTLPVELNASRRATEMLENQGILNSTEMDGAKRVLKAAVMTYILSVLISLVYFLRFLLHVLTIFGKRRD